MVFGTPVVLTMMTYPYPQEVYTLLVLVSSVMVFSNGWGGACTAKFEIV